MEYAIGLFAGLVIGLAMGFLIGRNLFGAMLGGTDGISKAKTILDKQKADPEFAKKLQELLNPPPPKPSSEPIRLLGLLQRESRLLDFLMENLGAYTDDQIGASVRDIQLKAQSTLKKYITLEPVMSQPENSKVTVNAGFDPSSIRLIGNVSGNPPFTGTLMHAGWKVKKADLPKAADGVDEFVLMPAEVEI